MNGEEVAVSWTGGKDSCLACQLAIRAGYRVRILVTFAPPGAGFIAHPVRVMALQAEAAGIPHRVITVQEPYEENYINALKELKSSGIRHIVTGDIDEVNGRPNSMELYCREAGIGFIAPLWKMKREEVFSLLMKEKINFIFTSVDKKIQGAAGLAGNFFSEELYWHLTVQSAVSGTDLCGENGEYHTMVTSAPFFRGALSLNTLSIGEDDQRFFVKIKNPYRILRRPGNI